MELTRLYIYGASGHGKVVAEIALASGHPVSGFIDDNTSLAGKLVVGLPICGGLEWLTRSAQNSSVSVGLGIGDNRLRHRIAQECKRLGIPVVTLTHPSAIISRSAVIGDGAILMAGAIVNAEAKIGDGAIINTGAVVEHDCRVGEYAHLSPNSSMGGSASIGMKSWLGMGATIIHQVSVGDGSTVGAGAVVIQDLPDNVVAVGVPARNVRTIHVEESGKNDPNK